MDISIEKMRDDHWPEVRQIFREGIDTGNATFETDAPMWEQWDNDHLADCRLVARHAGQVVAWAALCPVSKRKVYSGVAEISLYVKSSARRQGVGKALLRAAIEESERLGFWTLQSMTFPENTASIALQKSCGFKQVGQREQIGCMNGVWRDVILMERRSKTVGI